ncbi:type II toxin-antitoxin system RelE/ParE family toxin [uncultured Bacteroides sp.]|uniref:type II toxin-antitoxin system RelE/ParE family toxin n=1 Tax=uncultured Bacteroides sp. TaxID=162156 RepID=UPI0026163D26|nr:type II toxin-antitoxin system RelE/ParE family toxin [uncultured Bacteroides sp.]
MIVAFNKDYLRELYETGKNDKKHRFQPDIVKRYKDRINTLKNKDSIEALYNMKSLHYEVLKGDKAGISSIRVNDQYRIEFTVSEEEAETVVYICNILELSNHYK